MIIVDTDVLSELMRPAPDERVLRWMDQIRRGEFWTTSIVIAELSAGVAALPQGRRRLLLGDALDLMIERFDERVLPFGGGAALEYGRIVALRSQLGRPIGMADAQIAAIAMHADAVLATRDTGDFDGLGMELVDPWTAGG